MREQGHFDAGVSGARNPVPGGQIEMQRPAVKIAKAGRPSREYEGKPTTTIHRAVQLLQGRVQAPGELRGSAVPYFKELDPVVAAFSEPGIGVLS